MKLGYSCRKVAQLLSQRLDEPLGVVDSLRLRLHLSLCSNCQNVARQLSDVRTLSADVFSEGLSLETTCESRDDVPAPPKG